MATAVIPAFTATTLLLGGFNEFSIQLTLVGVLSITLHALITPTDLPGRYPNFDAYTPTQPPLRDYVLVSFLASLVFVSLISRIHSLLLSLTCAAWKGLRRVCLRLCGPVARQARAAFSRIFDFLGSLGRTALKHWDAIADYDFLPIPHIPQPHPLPSSPSPSHTFTDQWAATASTLAVFCPPTPQATTADPSETAALKLRVSQLEGMLEELRLRVDVLTPGGQGTGLASGTETTVTTKPHPIHTPVTSLSPNVALLSTAQPLTPSPLPTDEYSTLPAALRSGDTTFSAQENLRSLMGVIMDGTRQMDQLISNMRNILAETDDTTFETRKDEDNTPSALPTSRSMRIPLGERLPPLFTAAPISPSPYPSPSPSPSARLDRPLRTPAIRRTRVTSPLSTVNQIGETAKSSGTPGYNVTPDFSGLSGAPCSTPLPSAREVEQTTVPSPSFFGVLERLPATPVFKPVEEAGIKLLPTSRGTSRLAKLTPPRPAREFLARLRESSVKPSYSPPSRPVIDSPLSPRKEGKGMAKTTKLVEDISDWIAERRRKRNVPLDSRPSSRNRRDERVRIHSAGALV